MDVYAPLAAPLGHELYQVGAGGPFLLTILSLEAYQRIARMVAESREVRERFLAETIKTLTDRAQARGS